MNIGVVVFYAFKYIIAIIVCTIMATCLIKRGSLFDINDIPDKVWFQRYERPINITSVVITVLLGIAILTSAFPLIKDIPYMLRGEYCVVEGYVIYNEMGGASERVQDREVWVKDAETGNEIRIKTLDTGLKEGEYIIATYLPNSGLATINDRRQSTLKDNEGE